MNKPYEKFFERVMSYDDAINFIKSKDASFPAQNITPEIVTKYRKKFSKMYHPDVYKGDPDDFKNINNALDIISKGDGQSNYGSTYKPRYTRKPAGTPAGEPSDFEFRGGATGFEDVNNIKIYAKEKYGKTGEVYFFSAFDGAYSRLGFTAYCTNDMTAIEDMSNILVFWNNTMYETKGVLVSNKEMNLKKEVMAFKVVGDKIDVSSKKVFQHESFNDNPSNDKVFEKELRQWVRE